MVYSESVQRSIWTYTDVASLKKARTVANEQACTRIIKENAELKFEDFLSAEDELILCSWFETKIGDFAGALKLPLKVQATATVYYKRLYLHHSVMDYSPKEMMLVCLYLACKTEESRRTITDFLKPVPKDREKMQVFILEKELILAELLFFHLSVHHPFHAIEGFCIEMATPHANVETSVPVVDSNIQNKVYTDALAFARRSITSDVCLLLSPAAIAMASVYYAAKKHEVQDTLESHLRTKFRVTATAMDKCNDVEVMVEKKCEFDPKVMKRIMKRHSSLKKYLIDVNSQEYRDKLKWLADLFDEKERASKAL
eukprot:CFRG0519T1